MRRGLLLLLLGVLPLLAGCGGTAGDQSRLEEPDGRIAYLVDGTIRMRDLQSGARTDLTRTSSYSGEPQIVGWSSDGRTLTYELHNERRGVDVFEIDVEARSQRRLAHYGVNGVVARGGGRVAVPDESCEYDATAGEDLAAPLRLRIVKASGRLEHVFPVVRGLVSTMTVAASTWSPDDSRLAYEVTSWYDCYRNIPSTTLFESEPDGSNRTPLADYAISNQIEYAPDGRTLAFLDDCAVDADFCERVIAWDRHIRMNLTPGGTVAPTFAWMPTSDAILFVTSPRGSKPFRLVKVDIASGRHTDLGLIPVTAGHSLTFVRLARPIQHGVVVFSVNSRVYAASTDERRPFWSARWPLETRAYSETVFVRSP